MRATATKKIRCVRFFLYAYPDLRRGSGALIDRGVLGRDRSALAALDRTPLAFAIRVSAGCSIRRFGASSTE